MKTFLAIITIWVTGFVVYSNSFTIDFQFDDLHVVQSNFYVRSLEYIPRYFIDPKTSSYRPENSGYRPMTTTALALGFALSQNQTWGYHLIKIVEHCFVATLLFLLSFFFVTDFAYSIGLLSALIFVVHRVHTEVVDYISAISSLQAGLFFLLSFYLYLLFKKKNQRRFFIMSVVSFIFSILSKEEGITLPAVIVAYEWIYLKETNWKSLIKKIFPYLVAAIVFVFLRYSLMDPIAHTSRGNISKYIYAITQIRSWLYYWFLYFWPVNLNADNLNFEFSSGLDDLRIWGALCVHACILALAYKYRKRFKFLFFSVLWMYITVLPASSVFQLVEPVNEHRAYIPYMFLTLLLVYGIFLLFKQYKKSIYTGFSFCVLALGIGTFERNKIWQTDFSLWQDVYEKNPTSSRAMNILAAAYLNRYEFQKSLKLLNRCYDLSPKYLPCLVHLGIVNGHLKNYDEGLKFLLQGYKLDPTYLHINYHLGLYYKEYFHNYEKAITYFDFVEKQSSYKFFQATIRKAEILLEQGHEQQCLELIDRVLAMDHANGDAWEVYAKIQMLKGNNFEAMRIFQKLSQGNPESERYLLNMANVAERQKNYGLAKDYYEKSLKINSKLIQAWIGLERIAIELKDQNLKVKAIEQHENLKNDRESFEYSSMFFLRV